MNRTRRNSFVIVAFQRLSVLRLPIVNIRQFQRRTIVHENGAKVAHNIDHEEDGSFFRSHCQVAALRVASDRMVLRSGSQEVVNFGGTPKIGIGGVGYLKVNKPPHSRISKGSVPVKA